ncbi:MAG: GntR family transcriptional regulator [Eggerthellaceae bacterium]
MGVSLDIVISNASSKPIYEQIVLQMKDAILSGELEEGALLPSIRSLAGDLRISVITTKRAYAELEAQGFIETVQGKGSFDAGGNPELLREERLRHIEELLGRAVQEAQGIGLGLDEGKTCLMPSLSRTSPASAGSSVSGVRFRRGCLHACMTFPGDGPAVYEGHTMGDLI